jgi:tetratricopeptide (TPR) repeat protein
MSEVTVETPLAGRDSIFISYRRDDARGASGRLYDWLRIAFGRERVFRDVASIGVGLWRDKIDRALARSAACVAVIGRRWATAANRRRLHEEADMVRHELVTALASGDALMLVPTLVEGADMPTVEDLPNALTALFNWNVRRVTEDGWEDDIRRLIGEIADAAGLPVSPDVDTLLRDAGVAQQRIAAQQQRLQAEQIDALQRTVDELRRKLAEASTTDRPGFAAAFAALAKGDTTTAENAFEEEYERQSRAAAAAHQAMAEAARNVGNLALMHDITKAVTFYRKAWALEPEHAETGVLLGYALVAIGDLAGAEAALSQSLRTAHAHGDARGEMAAHVGLGDILQRTGHLGAAYVAYTRALQIGEGERTEDPANTQWQRDVSVSYDRIGDVLVAQGDGPGALEAYRKSLTIAERLAARDPANTQWQRDVAATCARLGLLEHGQSTETRRTYLMRARDILLRLKSAGRLMPHEDFTNLLDQELANLPHSRL